MSANKTNVNRRMYRRALHKDEKAVSPVVATLLLILIAVAAAAALYLWVTSFQSGTQKSIGSPGTQSTLIIGGSTTVYPLDVAAVSWFEQNNSNIAVTNNQGGSGAGLVALCAGDVDIAPASEYITQAANIPQSCLNEVVANRIGTSAVSVITGSNVGIASVNTAEMDCVYATNGAGTAAQIANYCTGADNTTSGLWAPTGTCASGITGVSGKCYSWNDLPKADGTACIWTGSPATAGAACATGAGVIQVYGRADNSGTAEGFIDQVLDTSCSSNILTNCFSAVTTLTGETALTAAILGNANALGFVSTGYASALGIASTQIASLEACTSYQQSPAWSTSPCTLQATPVAATNANIESGAYAAWRPLDFYTLGTPAGVAASFITFVEQPYVNAQLCALNYFVSYTSGAPSAPGQH